MICFDWSSMIVNDQSKQIMTNQDQSKTNQDQSKTDCQQIVTARQQIVTNRQQIINVNRSLSVLLVPKALSSF